MSRSVRRRIIREKVMQALYAHEISQDPPEHVIKHVLAGIEENKDAHAFAKQLVLATIHHKTDIDNVIRTKVANWEFDRIAMIDRLILRMSICELLYFKEIPPKVSMNEAIELAKLFSTERSGQFVNGILDAVLEDESFRRDMAKSGRGLYEGAPRVKRTKPVKT
jgi:N utilization substance protein B